MFVVAAQLRVPVIALVLRKAYGLGAMTMAAGGLQAPVATAAWPSGEFGDRCRRCRWAIAGNNVERNTKEGVVGYRVRVRLDDGHTRTFERTSLGNLHVGDRVRVEAGSFHRV